MRRVILFILIGLTSMSWMVFGQEVYRWVDEKGTIHFADDLTLIPEKYRGQIQQRKSPEKSPSPSIKTQGEMAIQSTPESMPERKDLLGRGEEWWRAKEKEWNGKLLNAQKNYDAVHSDLKKKEKELEDSKFKPDSLKRKLKGETKVLEERVKDWERQKEEAKNMLEKVLPKQVEDYQADPAWLKPKEQKEQEGQSKESNNL